MVTISLAPLDRPTGDLLLLGCFAGEEPPMALLPDGVRAVVQELVRGGGWHGREGQHCEATMEREELPRVALEGLGKRDELDLGRLQSWLAKAVAQAARDEAQRVVLALPEHELTRGAAATGRIIRWLALAQYRFDRFRERDEDQREVREVELLLPDRGAEVAREMAAAQEVAAGIAFARDLANTPPNVATPEWMSDQAELLAAELGAECEVLATEDLERERMGGVLAVGAGSENPPRMVRLSWRGGDGPHVTLVGKGVTFDTGGISIKPSKDMDEMKYDKCGACTVLGLLRAAAKLRLPLRLEVFLPLVENMPDGRSYRPGDIVRCRNGKTVEVLNTDAEGRMILADAMAWAAESAPDYLLELSTLTGACVVALGQNGAGLYTPSDALAGDLADAAERAGERLWRMPLWPEFKESMKGTHADLRNVAGRWGGANAAAAFLSHFVGDVARWAHLDIAGPAYVGSDGEGSKGATGYGVALGVDWLRRLAPAF
ncbi:MAG TPA: leucyl aminopeptidase [Thermoanaerobaculia bacterium]|nr:leucyl aminopeptidase [Thermoanaerobaculia bacterium]